jgi:tetratricopeptide (TPR) repeat protein
MRLFIISLALLFVTVAAVDAADAGDCRSCLIYSGYVTGDMGLWRKGMDELAEQYRRNPGPCTLFALTEARYGYIGYLLGRDDKEAARPLTDLFAADIERLATYPGYTTVTEAFRVALLGFRMGLSPARAVTLGPKALKQLEKAMKAGPASPEVWVEKANSESHMPAFAGGSDLKAAASFREALRLFEADSTMSPCGWRYLNTLVLLGQLLEKMGDYEGAGEAYKKALITEPGMRWVKDDLLPRVEKRAG